MFTVASALLTKFSKTFFKGDVGQKSIFHEKITTQPPKVYIYIYKTAILSIMLNVAVIMALLLSQISLKFKLGNT